MLVLHINWLEGADGSNGPGNGAGPGGLALWAESRDSALGSMTRRSGADALTSGPASGAAIVDAGAAAAATVAMHPFAVPAAEVRDALRVSAAVEDDDLNGTAQLHLLLPSDEHGPRPSDRLAAALGIMPDDAHAVWLVEHGVPAVLIRNHRALGALLRLEDHGPDAQLVFSPSVRYWQDVARFALDLLVDQRFVPSLVQQAGNRLSGLWQPWLGDEAIRARASALLAAMPPAVRAVAGDSPPRS